MNLVKQATKNTNNVTIAKNEKNFITKFEQSKNNVSLLNELNNELKTLKESKKVSSKFFIEYRKLIRVSILSINSELLKTIDKNDLIKVEINKKATDKQSATIGLNKLVQIHKKSLGACLSVLDKVFNDVKSEPNKEKEFVSVSYRVNKLTLESEKINTTYLVKFCPILSDVISYARKNSELYAFISLLFTSDELSKLTERKVLNAITKNIDTLQTTKAQIKERVKQARAKK